MNITLRDKYELTPACPGCGHTLMVIPDSGGDPEDDSTEFQFEGCCHAHCHLDFDFAHVFGGQWFKDMETLTYAWQKFVEYYHEDDRSEGFADWLFKRMMSAEALAGAPRG